jgi:hypothetical protein
VGSVRGETSVGHGGPKRARSRKRWKEAKGSLQLTESPLLGAVNPFTLSGIARTSVNLAAWASGTAAKE